MTEVKLTEHSRLAYWIHKMGTGRLFLIASAVTVLTWIGIGGLFYGLVRATGADLTNWASLEGISSLITTGLLVGGGLFAGAEYIESEEARRQAEQDRSRAVHDRLRQEYIFTVERLMNEDETNIRRWILMNISILKEDMDRDEWIAQTRETIFRNPNSPSDPRIGQRHIKHVLSTFDSLGFIMHNFGTLSQSEHLMDWMNPMVYKVWERIGPYVEEEARRRNEPNYYLWARRLGQTCAEWRTQRNYPPPEYVDDAL